MRTSFFKTTIAPPSGHLALCIEISLLNSCYMIKWDITRISNRNIARTRSINSLCDSNHCNIDFVDYGSVFHVFVVTI